MTARLLSTTAAQSVAGGKESLIGKMLLDAVRKQRSVLHALFLQDLSSSCFAPKPHEAG